MNSGSITAQFEGWAIVECMGHKRLAGHVRETVIAGAGMLRVDVPSEPPATQYVSPASIYALTPCTEDIARRMAKQCAPEPVKRWELPPADPDAGKAVPWKGPGHEVEDDRCPSCGTSGPCECP